HSNQSDWEERPDRVGLDRRGLSEVRHSSGFLGHLVPSARCSLTIEPRQGIRAGFPGRSVVLEEEKPPFPHQNPLQRGPKTKALSWVCQSPSAGSRSASSTVDSSSDFRSNERERFKRSITCTRRDTCCFSRLPRGSSPLSEGKSGNV